MLDARLNGSSAVGGWSYEEIENNVNADRSVLGKQCADIYSLLAQSDDEYVKVAAKRLRDRCCAHDVVVVACDGISERYSTQTADRKHCHLPFCPVCGLNKKVAKSNDFKRACRVIQQDKPTYKFLWLTISPPNFYLSDLKKVFPYMQKMWADFRKEYFKGENVGWIRMVHIKPPEMDTQNHVQDTVNFHYHVLLLVPQNFLCGEEVIAEWKSYWMNKGGWDRLNFYLDLIPNNSDKYEAALVKVRYGIRHTELLGASLKWAEQCVIQAYGMCLFSTGGILRKELGKALKDYNEERRSMALSFDRRQQDRSIVMLKWDFDQGKYVAIGEYAA